MISRWRFALEWDKIPQSHFRAECDGFVGRLKFIIHAKGGQFEQIETDYKIWCYFQHFFAFEQ